MVIATSETARSSDTPTRSQHRRGPTDPNRPRTNKEDPLDVPAATCFGPHDPSVDRFGVDQDMTRASGMRRKQVAKHNRWLVAPTPQRFIPRRRVLVVGDTPCVTGRSVPTTTSCVRPPLRCRCPSDAVWRVGYEYVRFEPCVDVAAVSVVQGHIVVAVVRGRAHSSRSCIGRSRLPRNTSSVDGRPYACCCARPAGCGRPPPSRSKRSTLSKPSVSACAVISSVCQ